MKFKTINKNGITTFNEVTDVRIEGQKIDLWLASDDGNDSWSLKMNDFDLIELDGEVLHESEDHKERRRREIEIEVEKALQDYNNTWLTKLFEELLFGKRESDEDVETD